MGRNLFLLTWHEHLNWSCNWFSQNLNVGIDKHKLSRGKQGHVLIIEATYDDNNFLLINLYNTNNEKNQIEVLDSQLLEDHNTAGDFNNIFNTILDASGGTPSLIQNTISKLISITKMLNTCVPFCISHRKCQRFSFRHKNPSLQRRLDYIILILFLQTTWKNVYLKHLIFTFIHEQQFPCFLTLN